MLGALARHLSDNETLYFLLLTTFVANIIIMVAIEIRRRSKKTGTSPWRLPQHVEREIQSILSLNTSRVNNPPKLPEFDDSFFEDEITEQSDETFQRLQLKLRLAKDKLKSYEESLGYYLHKYEQVQEDNEKLADKLSLFVRYNPITAVTLKAENLLLRKQNRILLKSKHALSDTLADTKQKIYYITKVVQHDKQMFDLIVNGISKKFSNGFKLLRERLDISKKELKKWCQECCQLKEQNRQLEEQLQKRNSSSRSHEEVDLLTLSNDRFKILLQEERTKSETTILEHQHQIEESLQKEIKCRDEQIQELSHLLKSKNNEEQSILIAQFSERFTQHEQRIHDYEKNFQDLTIQIYERDNLISTKCESLLQEFVQTIKTQQENVHRQIESKDQQVEPLCRELITSLEEIRANSRLESEERGKARELLDSTKSIIEKEFRNMEALLPDIGLLQSQVTDYEEKSKQQEAQIARVMEASLSALYDSTKQIEQKVYDLFDKLDEHTKHDQQRANGSHELDNKLYHLQQTIEQISNTVTAEKERADKLIRNIENLQKAFENMLQENNALTNNISDLEKNREVFQQQLSKHYLEQQNVVTCLQKYLHDVEEIAHIRENRAKEVELLRSELDGLKRKLEESNEDLNEAYIIVQNNEKRIEDLTEKLAHAEKKNMDISSKYEEISALLTEARKEKTDVEEKYDTLVKKHSEVREKLEKEKSERINSQECAETSKLETEQMRNNLEEKKKEVAHLSELHKEAQLEIEGLKIQLQHETQIIEAERNKYKTAEILVAELKSQLNAASLNNQRIEELSRSYANLVNEISGNTKEFHDTIDTLQKQLSGKDCQITMLSAKLIDNDATLRHIQNMISELDLVTNMEEFKSKCMERISIMELQYQSKVERMKDRITYIIADRRRLVRANESLESQMRELNEKHNSQLRDQLETVVANAKIEFSANTEALRLINEQVNILKQENERIIHGYEGRMKQAREDYDLRVKQYQTIIDEQKNREDASVKEKRELLTKLHEVQFSLEQQTHLNNELEQRLRKNDEKIASLETEKELFMRESSSIEEKNMQFVRMLQREYEYMSQSILNTQRQAESSVHLLEKQVNTFKERIHLLHSMYERKLQVTRKSIIQASNKALETEKARSKESIENLYKLHEEEKHRIRERADTFEKRDIETRQLLHETMNKLKEKEAMLEDVMRLREQDRNSIEELHNRIASDEKIHLQLVADNKSLKEREAMLTENHKAELGYSKAEIDQLHSLINLLCSTHDRIMDNMTQVRNDAHICIDMLQKKLIVQNNRLSIVRNSYSTSILSLETKNKMFAEEMSHVSKEYTEACNRFKEEKNSMEQQISMLTASISIQEKGFTDARKEIEELKNHLNIAENNNKNLVTKMMEEEQKYSAMITELSAKLEEMQHFKANIESDNNKLIEMMQQYDMNFNKKIEFLSSHCRSFDKQDLTVGECIKRIKRLGTWTKEKLALITKQETEIAELKKQQQEDADRIQDKNPSIKLHSPPISPNTEEPYQEEGEKLATKCFMELMAEVGYKQPIDTGKSIFSMMRSNRRFSIDIANNREAKEKFLNDEINACVKAIQLWIERTIDKKFDQNLDFFTNLLPGLFLCELVEKLFPDAIEGSNIERHSNEMPSAMNNVDIFKNSCMKLEIPQQNWFGFNDLKDKKNIENILACLAFIFIKSIKTYGPSGPKNDDQAKLSPVEFSNKLSLNNNVPKLALGRKSPTFHSSSSPSKVQDAFPRDSTIDGSASLIKSAKNDNIRRSRSNSLRPQMRHVENLQTELTSPQLTARSRLKLGNKQMEGNITARGEEEGNTTAHELMFFMEQKKADQEGRITARDYENMRKNAIEKQELQTEKVLQEWIESVMNTKFSPDKSLNRNLDGGVLLCRLMSKLFPGCIDISKIKENNNNSPFITADNLALFFDACNRVEISQILMLTADELSKENKQPIIACLSAIYSRAQQPWSPRSAPTPTTPTLDLGNVSSRVRNWIPSYSSTATNSPRYGSPPRRKSFAIHSPYAPVGNNPVGSQSHSMSVASSINFSSINSVQEEVKPKVIITEEEKLIINKIESAIDVKFAKDESLHSHLSDGLYLCMLMQKFYPNAPKTKKIVEASNKGRATPGKTSVEAFIGDCIEKVNIQMKDLFNYQDLVNGTNKEAIINCLNWILSGRIAQDSISISSQSVPSNVTSFHLPISQQDGRNETKTSTSEGTYSADLEELIEDIKDREDIQEIIIRDEVKDVPLKTVEPDQLEALINSLTCAEDIKVLDFGNCLLSDKMISNFAEKFVRNRSKIEELDLSGNEINSNTQESLLKLIDKSIALKCLKLSYNIGNDNWIESLREAGKKRNEKTSSFNLVIVQK